MSPRSDRPRLSANREPLVSAQTPASTPPEDEAIPTGGEPRERLTGPASFTLSLRVPTPVAHRVQREIRRLHFETGRHKGVIAATLLEVALAHMDEIEQRLSANE